MPYNGAVVVLAVDHVHVVCCIILTQARFTAGDRMRLARSANKPLLLEEFGAPRSYIWPPATGRDKVMSRRAAVPDPTSCPKWHQDAHCP